MDTTAYSLFCGQMSGGKQGQALRVGILWGHTCSWGMLLTGIVMGSMKANYKSSD